MPFCYAPWTNIDIDSQGEITPCCKFNILAYQESPRNIRTHTIEDYTKSATLNQVKQEFVANKWPAGCERCQIEEENNIKSKRQLDQLRWNEHYSNYDISSGKLLTASVAFGNTCNLTCITCGPNPSSRWQAEAKKIYNIDIAPNHFYKNDFADNFMAHARDLIHIDIPGGEPLLGGVPVQHQILQRYIESGQSKNLSLHYTTNGTIFPGLEWWDLWAHFKEVEMQLSIDGVGDRYEYIRFPANWELTNANVTKYLAHAKSNSNFKLSVSTTVSAFNIAYLNELLDWCAEVGLPKPWLGRVHMPRHFRPSVWPAEAKQHIISRLKNGRHLDTRTWAMMMAATDDSEFFSEFVSRTQQHDQYRKLDFSSTFPEMAKYFT